MSTAELMKRKLDKGHLTELDEDAFKDKLDKIEKVVTRTSKIIQAPSKSLPCRSKRRCYKGLLSTTFR